MEGLDRQERGWVPAAHDAEVGGLQDRLAAGARWTMLEQLGRQLFSLLGFIVIARLVAPEDVGVVALAAVFVSFAQIFVESGIGDALVQRRVLEPEHIHSAFWLSLAFGLMLAVSGVVLAIPIGALLNEPRLVPILQVLSLGLVLYGLVTVQTALLRRELAQRSLAARGLIASSGGVAVGVTIAILGGGPWALVGQQLTMAILSVIALWAASPWRPRARVSLARFGELYSFGIAAVGANILAFVDRRLDNLLVGTFLGTAALGFYAVGYRTLEAAQSSLGGIANRIAFPAFSRLQNDPSRLRRAVLRVNTVSGAIVVPGFLGLALVGADLISLVFGPRWQAAGPVAAVLFLVGPAYAMSLLGAAALSAAGHPRIALRLRVAGTAGSVIGFVLGAAVVGSTVAVAAFYVTSQYLLLPLTLYLAHRYVGLPVRQLAWELRGVALASLLMVGAVLAVKVGLEAVLVPAALLPLEAVIGGTAYAVGLRLLDHGLFGEVLELATLSIRRRPKGIKAAGEGLRPADTPSTPGRRP